MKKLISLLLIAVMSISLLCACASNDSASQPTDTATPDVSDSESVETKLGSCSVNIDYANSVTKPDYCIKESGGDYEYTYLIISDDAASTAVASVGIPCQKLDFDDTLSTNILYQDDEYLLFEVSMYECSYLISMNKADLSFRNLPNGSFTVCGDKIIYTNLVYAVPANMDIIVYDFGLNKLSTLVSGELVALTGCDSSAYYYAVVSADFDTTGSGNYQVVKYSVSSNQTETVASGTGSFDDVMSDFSNFCNT